MATLTKSDALARTSSRFRPGMDPIMYEANGGILHLVDFGFPFCRPKIAPVDAQVVKDISGYTDPAATILSGHADGQLKLAGAGYMTYANNGVGFANAVGSGTYHETPASVAAHIVGSNQNFAVWVVVKMQALADWVTGASTRPYICWSTGGNGYGDSPDLLTIGTMISGGVKYVVFARSRGAAAGSVDTQIIAINDTDCDKVALLGFWRAGGEQYGYFQNSLRAEKTALITDNGLNTTSGVSALTGKLGIGPSLWGGTTGGPRDWKAYRLGVADLDICRSGYRASPWNDVEGVMRQEWEWFNSAERAALIGTPS